jgi:hypothetical protein
LQLLALDETAVYFAVAPSESEGGGLRSDGGIMKLAK